jgi:hypothetical protein
MALLQELSALASSRLRGKETTTTRRMNFVVTVFRSIMMKDASGRI